MILKVEMKDLEEDLSVMEEIYQNKKDDGQITNYVYMENMAVLKEEIRGIEKIITCLNESNPEDYESIDDFISQFTRLCRENQRNVDLPEAVYAMFTRKIHKVKQYIFE